ETAKWVGALKSPVTGEITEANPDLKSQPKLINEDPYGKGWLVTVKPAQLGTDKENLIAASQAAEWLKEVISKEKK
ncbi:MAG: glycine cleavage system protein H, partial [Aigarchaeota archaeon]|nr:glycine cleavage system protein H [Aigarchaeota archaeon]